MPEASAASILGSEASVEEHQEVSGVELEKVAVEAEGTEAEERAVGAGRVVAVPRGLPEEHGRHHSKMARPVPLAAAVAAGRVREAIASVVSFGSAPLADGRVQRWHELPLQQSQ